MSKSPLKITDTTLRDAQQSIWASKITTDEITELLKNLDQVGFHSLEVWGGGIFENALRFWKEDPWERLNTIAKTIKHTPMQMLLRGQNIVGYHPYPDDVLEAFIKQAIDSGISIVRTFDALNDIRNVEQSIAYTKKYGAHAQGTLCYTINPYYDLDFLVQYAMQLRDIGADSIAIKDAAGILTPLVAATLIKRLKKEVKLPLQLHSHITNGVVNITYYEAVKAGVDIIDCTMGQLLLTGAQPSVESILRLSENTPYQPTLSKTHIDAVSKTLFEICRCNEIAPSWIPFSDDSIFSHQLPRGAYRFLYEQLKKRNALDRLPEVLEEIPRVRNDVGAPPLFIPISQIIVPQAVYNVLIGKRYQLVSREIKDLVRGKYGKIRGPIDPQIAAIAQEEGPSIEGRPSDALPPLLEATKTKLEKKYVKSETDYLSYALFPDLALDFFKWRECPDAFRDEEAADKEISPEEEVLLLNKLMQEKGVVEFELEENNHYVFIKRHSDSSDVSHPLHHTAHTSAQQKQQAPLPVEPETEDIAEAIISPIVGIFYAQPGPSAPAYVKSGDTVRQGQTVCIIEAMKVMNEIKAPFDCEIIKPLIGSKTPVKPQQPLFSVKKI